MSCCSKPIAAVMVVGLSLVSSIGGSPNRAAYGQEVDWDGSDSSDYFTGANWFLGAVPTTGEVVNVGKNDPYTNAPVYSGDNSATPAGDVVISEGFDGTFTMSSGLFVTSGNFQLGVGGLGFNTTGTLNMIGGEIRLTTGTLDTSRIKESTAVINMTAGLIDVYNTSSSAIRFAGNEDGTPGGPDTTCTIDMSGGTIKSGGRIVFGRSNSNDPSINNARALVDMSDGLMWASGSDGNGTIQFAGGKINLSGGIIRGGDISSRDGFNRVCADGRPGGVDFMGGVIEVITDLNEGNYYPVPLGVDPTTVTPIPLQRGQNRALSFAYRVQRITNPAPEQRFHTTLADHAVKVAMDTDPVSGKQRARVFATLKGDFDVDGDVDGNDFLAWQVAFGLTYITDPFNPAGSLLPYYGADGDGDGDVDGDDFLVWKTQFGQPSGASSSSAVPEPSGVVLFLVGLVLAITACRRPTFRRS